MRINLELIDNIPNRREYMARLLTETVLDDWKPFFQGKGTDQEFLTQIKNWLIHNPNKFDLNSMQKVLSKKKFELLKELVTDGTWNRAVPSCVFQIISGVTPRLID